MPSKSYSDSFPAQVISTACLGFSYVLKALPAAGITGMGAVITALVVVLMLWSCLKG